MREGRQRGAFVMDVMIAVCILSIGFLAVVGLFIRVSQSGQDLDRLEQASYLAEDGMERLRHQGSEEWTSEALLAEAGSEPVDKNGVHFVRSITLRMRPDLDPAGHLMEAEVRVGWNEKAGARSIVLMTYYAVDTELENLR